MNVTRVEPLNCMYVNFNLTEEILSITAGSDQGSYAKPLLCKRYCLTRSCVSLNFRPETTFS